jgi:hypothetical protein
MSFKYLFFTGLITYVLMEIVCAVFIYTGYIDAYKPGFTLLKSPPTPYVQDTNFPWGLWHGQQPTFMNSNCYSANYYSNSIGARDKERVINGDTARIIFLGDSFIEGYAMDTAMRVSNQVEKRLHQEVLNFGVSCTAPTQYYLLYKHLAKQYSHNAVLVGIFPTNDFTEDDMDYWRNHVLDNQLHKPFWVGTYPNYQLTYFLDSLSQNTNRSLTFSPPSPLTSLKLSIKTGLKEYTYWFNILNFVRLYDSNNTAYSKYLGGDVKNVSPYFEYPKPSLQRLCYNLSKIKEEATGKKISILLIPTTGDIARYLKEHSTTTPLSSELSTWCQSESIEVIDLLPIIAQEHPSDYTSLFLSCDGHWSEEGNRYVADKLAAYLH